MISKSRLRDFHFSQFISRKLLLELRNVSKKVVPHQMKFIKIGASPSFSAISIRRSPQTNFIAVLFIRVTNAHIYDVGSIFAKVDKFPKFFKRKYLRGKIFFKMLGHVPTVPPDSDFLASYILRTSLSLPGTSKKTIFTPLLQKHVFHVPIPLLSCAYPSQLCRPTVAGRHPCNV